MGHHFNRLEEIKATRKRLKKENNVLPPKRKMALGNINEFNELTLALANPGVIIGKAGFHLGKGGMSVVRNVLNRAKNALNTRTGKLVQKHADDLAMISSLGSQTK